MAEITIEKCPLCGAEIEKTTVLEEGNRILIDCKEEFKLKRWIPVEDALPEEDVSVICYTRIGEIVVMEYVGDGWYSGITRYNPRVVSHWMPLPEPPESEVT